MLRSSFSSLNIISSWKTLLVLCVGISIGFFVFSGRATVSSSPWSEDPITAKLRGMIVDNRDGHMGPYNMSKSNVTDFSEGQSSVILKHLNGKRKGTFFEAGAFDGEFISNTFKLEYENEFTGILVEPQKEPYKTMLTKHRKAAMLNACISPTGQPLQAAMNVSVSDNVYHKGSSALAGYHWVDGQKHATVTVDCYPLINILEAAGLTKLDVLSLDVQGAERDVLRTLPWEKVDIRLLLLENDHYIPHLHQQILDDMKAIVGKQGYKQVDKIGTNDYVFLKE